MRPENNERFLHGDNADSIMRHRIAANKTAGHAGRSIVSREELQGGGAGESVAESGAGAKLGRASRFEIRIRESRTAVLRKPLKMRDASDARARNLRLLACTSGGRGSRSYTIRTVG